MVVELQILGIESTEWLILIIAAFGGGAFGAALGALPAFCFTGFMVIAGEALNVLQEFLAETAGLDPGTATAGITATLGFGPVFGPHISFAGGVAAAAYASKRGYMAEGFDYHLAKDIAQALGTKPDVLAVGGLFGIFGLVCRQALVAFAAPIDQIAITVVISAFLARLVFGYPLVGKVGGSGYFDMTPFEQGQTRTVSDTDGPTPATDGGTAEEATEQRMATEPWLPFQYKWANVAMIGLVAGILGAFIAYETGSAFLGFGISAATLTFLALGTEVPVTHHITLVASTATLSVLAWGPIAAIVVGTAFGIVSALSGEVLQRLFYAHGDTHVDPPAFAIAVNTFVIAALAMLGVFPDSAWVTTL
ncbi:hypothetical protein ACFPYI_09665 [Halomarina salina]|uniref:DUF7973 domain-containing protein n=1 Tax=Halomarina salina TaxID=1872699 RepID=A0ABD5RML6_9EURY|nr:hypothetical protein [Halomarina salina]